MTTSCGPCSPCGSKRIDRFTLLGGAQPPGGDHLVEQLFQAGLEERRFLLVDRVDLVAADVAADNLMA